MTTINETSGVKTMKRFNLLWASLAAVAIVTGCTAPPMLDRTQPNYFKKSDLLNGVWYIQGTIVDMPANGTAAVVGFGGDLEKVRWQIHEDLLVGYRAYEVIPGIDPRVDKEKSRVGKPVFLDGTPFMGSPVYAYKIVSHFDRQRMYNAATGEQTNVLVEDSQDRPWYDREFIRVDWKVNQLMNIRGCDTAFEDGCGQSGAFLHYTTAQDQNPTDEAMVTERNSNGELSYFDFTTQLIVDPQSVYIEGYGAIPYCYFSPNVDCESQNVKIRTSVKKVDEERVMDYEPLAYDDKMMTKFGFFRAGMAMETLTYDKGYGFTDTGRIQYAQRHNIWKRAHYTDKVDAQGRPVTIPVAQREIRPVVYYLTQNFPKELMPWANGKDATGKQVNEKDNLEYSWDHAFRRAVAVSRGIEPEIVPQMFYVCESPVPEGAPAACGKKGTYARLGDLRYNLIPYVQQIAGGLLGLGPSSLDPETGEIVQAVANVYGPGLDTWSASSQQIVDVLNGEIKLEDLIVGQDIKDHVFANLGPTDPRRADGPAVSKQPLMSVPTREPLSTFARPKGQLLAQLEQYHQKGHMPLRTQDRKAVVRKLIEENPALESELLNIDEVRQAVMTQIPDRALHARLEADPALYRSLARQVMFGEDPVSKARDNFMRMTGPSVGCMYHLDYFDEDYLGVAKTKLATYKAKFAALKAQGLSDAQAKTQAKKALYDEFRGEAWRSVAEHEVGHTVGLMHNFIGSADAMNYKDGYWDLRKDSIGVVVGGKRVLPVTAQNLVDAAQPTQKQLDNGMYEYTYSTIMDYGARVNSQNKGIGKYDEAAILFGYSGGYEPGYVEVFNETRHDYTRTNVSMDTDVMNRKLLVRGAHTEIPLSIVQHYTPVSTMYSDRFHYTTLPFHFAEEGLDFDKALDQGIARMNNRSYRKWSDMQVWYGKLEAELKNFNLSAKSFDVAATDTSRTIVAAVLKNAKGELPVEVPYMFCSDYEVGANILCNRNDQGADVYEMTQKWLERFENTYVFANFRRDRYFFSPSGVANGKFGRYVGNLPNVYQQWLFNSYFVYDAYRTYGITLTPEQLEDFFGAGDPVWQNYYTMAVVDSTNVLMQLLATPSVGYHGKKTGGNWELLPENKSNYGKMQPAAEAAYFSRMRGLGYNDFSYVPRGPGRVPYTQYDTKGYDFFTRANESGHFWDQIIALNALTTSETNFLGVDRGADALRYSLPYYITFNKELAPLFGSMWAQEPANFAPQMGKLANGDAVVVPPVFVRAENYINNFIYPPPAGSQTAGPAPVMEKVEPVTSWGTRFYAQVFGMAYFTENYNQEYASFNQIYRLGSGEALTPTDNYTVSTFPDVNATGATRTCYAALDTSDPDGRLRDLFSGGYTYAALKQSASTSPKTPSVQLIERAQTLTLKYCDAATPAAEKELTLGKLRETVRALEMSRGLYNIFGRAI
jgi:hypothetical protein